MQARRLRYISRLACFVFTSVEIIQSLQTSLDFFANYC